jgi:hypothetical protein
MRDKATPGLFFDSFLFQAAVLTALCLIVFGASIGFAYCLDDYDLFTKIHQLPGPLAIFGAGDIFQTYYRPLFILSLAFEHSLTQAPWLHHLVNVLLHAGVAVLALTVARQWLPSSHWAFVAALAFAIHPTRAENVAWISGRTDILASGGMLLALLLLGRARRERKAFLAILSGLSGILAMFSKETALLSPLLLLGGWWILTPALQPRPRKKTPGVAEGAVLGICLALQGAGIILLLILRSAARSGVPMEPLFPSLGGTLLNALRNFALYLWHTATGGGEEYLVLGWRMVQESGFNFMPLPRDSLHLLSSVLAALLFLGWALWALFGLRHSDPPRRRSFRVVVVSLGLFSVFLFPTLGFIPIQYNYSTRFLYLPLLFFVMALGGTADLIVVKGEKKEQAGERISLILSLVCMAGLLLGTVKTLRDTLRWKDDVTLFSYLTAKCPQAPVAFSCLGNGYRHRAENDPPRNPVVLADWLNAARYSEKARRIWPQFRDAYLTEAGALRMAARVDPIHTDSCLRAAIQAYAAGAQAIPGEPLLPMYAGDTFLDSGNLPAAEDAYQDALRRAPRSPEIQERLKVLSQMKANSISPPSSR